MFRVARFGAVVAALRLCTVAAALPGWRAGPGHLRAAGESLLSLASPAAWHPQDVPNPYTNPSACNIDRPGYFCDPDKFLPPEDRAKVLNIMDLIRQNTSVACPDGASHGYQVAGVVIRKMASSEFVHGSTADTAEKFARGIGNRFGVGDAGCDNGVMVFLSIDDRYAYIATGKKAQEVLTDSTATQIVDNIKPLLREGRYDEAVLEAVLQIYDVLRGQGLPVPDTHWTAGKVIGISIFLTIWCGGFLAIFAPYLLMGCCFVGASLLLPCARLADKFKAQRQQAEDEAEHRQAQRELASMQAELQRDEFDQAVCPICLESLEQQVDGQGTQALECRHRYHAQCIGPWVQQHGSCPLCRADATIPLPEEDAKMPDGYQRRLRGYLATMRVRHPRVFEAGSSRGLYQHDPRTELWVLFPLADCHNSLSYSEGYATYVSSHYDSVMSSAHTWAQSRNNSSGSSGSSGGFGGGGFSGGGGGGGGW